MVQPLSGSHTRVGAAPGLPVQCPALWSAKDLQGKPEIWAYQLSEADITELDAAVDRMQALNIDLKDVKKEDAAMPILGARLEGFCQELNDGRGFQLIRGVPVARYTLQQSVTAFWIIGLHFGIARPQNRRQHLLGHVKDVLPGGAANPVNRTYGTAAAQPWHVDECDIVGLLCLQNAKEGGHSQWSCSAAIHNEMLKQSPELYQELLQPLYVDRKDEIPPGKLPYYQIPVFNFHKGRMATYYVSSYYQVCQRHHPATPKLTKKQHAAFAEFDRLASSPELSMNWEAPGKYKSDFYVESLRKRLPGPFKLIKLERWILQPGDMQFLQNHAVVHNRSAFTDYEEESKRRHLLRLWLSPQQGWPLPECYAERYGSIEVGNRGGIWIPGSEPHVPLDAKSGL